MANTVKLQDLIEANTALAGTVAQLASKIHEHTGRPRPVQEMLDAGPQPAHRIRLEPTHHHSKGKIDGPTSLVSGTLVGIAPRPRVLRSKQTVHIADERPGDIMAMPDTASPIVTGIDDSMVSADSIRWSTAEAVLQRPNRVQLMSLLGESQIPTAVSAELASIASTLSAKFPDLAPEDVTAVVNATYARLESTARIRAHLIPLTINHARAILENKNAEHGICDISVSTSARTW
ncbi:MAG: hypothetical protein ABIY38_11455 [Rhodococcus sp. (in: high G+C Gram-positive bacteria)]